MDKALLSCSKRLVETHFWGCCPAERVFRTKVFLMTCIFPIFACLIFLFNMKQNNLNKHRAIVFRHFTRKGYALFSVLGREVRIGVLSVATLAAAAPRLAQAAATLPSDDAGVWATDTIGLDEAKVTATRAVSRVAVQGAGPRCGGSQFHQRRSQTCRWR